MSSNNIDFYCSTRIHNKPNDNIYTYQWFLTAFSIQRIFTDTTGVTNILN